MRAWGCRACAVSLLGALWLVTVDAAEFMRHDGIHRIEKKAQITDRAVLDRRDGDQDVCGTSMKLCPSSFNGGCCPDNYDCAKESCYATTKGPSTCGTLVGWHVCDAVYGAGCCPDGYLCQTAGNCVPPSGSAYTYGCPASHHLCPPSLSYGCCPNGMACAVNQCYSTEPASVTTSMVITTTADGVQTTYKTAVVTVITPAIPSTLPTAAINDDSQQAVLKYFPSAIAKVTPSSTAAAKHDGGGLSTGMIAGIVGGAVAFLIVVLVAAFIIIRHLNKVVAAVSTKQSESSRSRPVNKDFKPTDSEVDALSVDPLMMSPRPTRPRGNSKLSSTYVTVSPDSGSNDVTPSAVGEGYQSPPFQSRHTSMDTSRADGDYFDGQTGFNRYSRRSSDTQGAYTHVRNLSYGSESSDNGYNQGNERHQSAVPSELEGTPYIPELPTTPVVASPQTDRRRSSGSSVGIMTRPERTHQRKRSEQRSMSEGTGPPLTVVDEEIHGFHGPYDHFAGQTLYRPTTRSPPNSGSQAPGGQYHPSEGTEGSRNPT